LVAFYHAELAEAQADPALCALFGRSNTSTPFDRIEWLRLLAEECLPGQRCFLAVARSDTAVAALPLVEGPDGIRSLANWYSFIARPRFTASAQAPTLLNAIAKSIAPFGAVQLTPMPSDEAGLMIAALRRAGWIAQQRACGVNHVLNLQGRTYDDYWKARPGRLRETVRRKGRKNIVDIRIVDQFTHADWNAYETVYRQSWKPGEGSPAFLRRFAQAESAAGGMRLGLATISGQPVAAQFWTVEGGTAFIHKLAHDDTAKAHSPGTLLTAALLRHVIDLDNVQLVDFGTGDDGYKRDWMETVRPRYAIEAYRLSSPRHWNGLIRMAARAILRPDRHPLVSTRPAG